MKNLISITLLLLFCSSLYGQKKVKKKTELRNCAGVTIIQQFQVGDTLLTCNTCHWDQCGNVINSNLDTLYKNKTIVNSDFKPIFLTIDSILLTKKQVGLLLDKNKIRHMQFLHCNEVANKMGFLALEGLYFIELKDTTLKTIALLDAIRMKLNDSTILTSQILINGYRLKAGNIKYPIQEIIATKYLEKSNLYCVLTD